MTPCKRLAKILHNIRSRQLAIVECFFGKILYCLLLCSQLASEHSKPTEMQYTPSPVQAKGNATVILLRRVKNTKEVDTLLLWNLWSLPQTYSSQQNVHTSSGCSFSSHSVSSSDPLSSSSLVSSSPSPVESGFILKTASFAVLPRTSILDNKVA